MRDLEGRVALITGGSKGIGLATASLLACRGAHVVICARRRDALEAARATIDAPGGKVEAIVLDVTDYDAFATPRANGIRGSIVNVSATVDYSTRAPGMAARTTDTIPMGRGSEREELAEAIVFMLSDAASYIIGMALPVDGGKAAQLYIPS